MKNIGIRLFAVLMVFSNPVRGQINSYKATVEHYVSNSIEIKNIVQKLSDTCNALYTCGDLNRLIVTDGGTYNSSGEVILRATLLIEPNSANLYFNDLGMVVLKVDSIDLIVQKELLFRSCLMDSVQYIGIKPYILRHDSFESCLHNFGVVLTAKVFCNRHLKPELSFFDAYITEGGKKKLKKALRARAIRK